MVESDGLGKKLCLSDKVYALLKTNFVSQPEKYSFLGALFGH
jgi:hypothetical protein